MNGRTTDRVPITEQALIGTCPIIGHVPITDRNAFRGRFLIKRLHKDVFTSKLEIFQVYLWLHFQGH